MNFNEFHHISSISLALGVKSTLMLVGFFLLYTLLQTVLQLVSRFQLRSAIRSMVDVMCMGVLVVTLCFSMYRPGIRGQGTT